MIYTIGYSGLTLPTLKEIVHGLAAILIDIRYRAASRNPVFAKSRLEAAFGLNYRHRPALGNINYKGGPIQLADYPTGRTQIRELVATHRSILLLGVCAEVDTCHRRTAAEQLSADLEIPMSHLQRPRLDVPRLFE